MLTKGVVCESIAGILKQYGGVSMDSLIHLLISFQNQRITPIAPIKIENEVLQSDYIESCLMDMEQLRTIKKNDTISLTKKGLDIYIDQNIDHIDRFNLGEQYLRDFILIIKGHEFKVHFQANEHTYNFCRLLPLVPEIGALFSINKENVIFNKCIPLFYNEIIPAVSYLLLNDVDSDIKEMNIKKNMKRIRGVVYQFLKDRFDQGTIDRCMILIFYNLLPISTTYLSHNCTNNHEASKLYENYIDLFLSPIETVCSNSYCRSRISLLKNKLINEKIYDAWKNGILMEWYGSKLLTQITKQKSFYNVDIDNIQCDAISYDDDYVYLMECKRINSYNSQYIEGIKQLKDIKRIFDKKGIDTRTILFTTINDVPKVIEDVDLIITKENFLKFSLDPSI